MTNPQSNQNLDFPYWLNRDGKLALWDDPSIVGGIVLPEPYRPQTHLGSILSKFNYGFLEELDVILLKIIGDAIAINEDQIKRLLEQKVTRTQVSNRLKKLREFGYVDRWQIESSHFDEEKPPAPFTLGLSGFIFLKHFYYSNFFMDPQRWQRLGLQNIQRYVAVNEIRTQIVENKLLRNWIWNGVINNNPQLFQIFGFAEIEIPQGNLNLAIERVQQSKKFIPYLNERLTKWEQVQIELGHVPVKGFANNPFICVISVSSYSLAQHIHKELVLEQKNIPIWICVEEDLVSKGLGKSLYSPTANGLVLIDFDFLN